MRNSNFGTVGAQMAGLRAHRRRGAQGSAPAHSPAGRAERLLQGARARVEAACILAARVEVACSEPFLMFFDRFSIFSTRICSE